MVDDAHRDPFADVINVLAAPIAGGIRSVEQFQRGIGELFRAIDNLNTTLETLNETAGRINTFLADVEEPVRAMMPQLTRTIQAADEMTQLLQTPIRTAAPNVEQIVETLSSPGFAALPNQLGEFMSTIGDVSKRLGPLTQFAETAGGLFGGLKLPGMAPSPTASEPPTAPPTAKKAPAKKATTKPAAKKPTAKKPTAKKAAAKKAAAHKPAKKSTKK